jgi:hypothetical protein
MDTANHDPKILVSNDITVFHTSIDLTSYIWLGVLLKETGTKDCKKLGL